MRSKCRVIGNVIFLLAALCATAQAGSSKRKVVLPNPQLIHCRSAGCAQLWKQDSPDGGAVYPAQILTDFVSGEVIGLTAVYDRSVSEEELRAAIYKLYGEQPPTFQGTAMSAWRIEAEQLAISISDGTNGAKKVIYLKFGALSALTPAEHIDCRK